MPSQYSKILSVTGTAGTYIGVIRVIYFYGTDASQQYYHRLEADVNGEPQEPFEFTGKTNAQVANILDTAEQRVIDALTVLANTTITDAAEIGMRNRGYVLGAIPHQSELISYVSSIIPYSSYRTILMASGSHTAAKAAGTYGLAAGDPAAITGTGTLYPLQVIHIAAADFPTVGGKAAKLRVKAVVEVNDVAPTGTYIFGLHPITRPATSGGAGLNIYTIGARVTGSATGTFNAPAADSQTMQVSSDFDLPTDGFYVLGFVQTGTVATSSHLHLSAYLQMRNA